MAVKRVVLYCTMFAAWAPRVVSSAVMMVTMISPMRRSNFLVLSFIFSLEFRV